MTEIKSKPTTTLEGSVNGTYKIYRLPKERVTAFVAAAEANGANPLHLLSNYEYQQPKNSESLNCWLDHCMAEYVKGFEAQQKVIADSTNSFVDELTRQFTRARDTMTANEYHDFVRRRALEGREYFRNRSVGDTKINVLDFGQIEVRFAEPHNASEHGYIGGFGFHNLEPRVGSASQNGEKSASH